MGMSKKRLFTCAAGLGLFLAFAFVEFDQDSARKFRLLFFIRPVAHPKQELFIH